MVLKLGNPFYRHLSDLPPLPPPVPPPPVYILTWNILEFAQPHSGLQMTFSTKSMFACLLILIWRTCCGEKHMVPPVGKNIVQIS